MEVAANLGRRIGLGVPQVLVGHPADDENEDAIDILFRTRRLAGRGFCGAGILQSQDFGQAQAGQRPDAQKAAAINSVTEGGKHISASYLTNKKSYEFNNVHKKSSAASRGGAAANSLRAVALCVAAG